MALSFVVTGTVWRWLFQPNSGINVMPTMIGQPPLTTQWFIDTGKILAFSWRDVLIGVGAIIFLMLLWFASSSQRRIATRAYITLVFGAVSGVFILGALNLPATIAREGHG